MKKRVISILSIMLSAGLLFAQELNVKDEGPRKLEYKYRENDSYRILSTVKENVYINGRKNHSAEILNRIAVKVTSVDKEKKSAVHEGTFMTSESSTYATAGGNKVFSYGDEYKSIFERDSFGVYTIEDIYFMPVVRDVPVFPDKELSVNEEWTYDGHEAHDLRRTFDLEKPYKVPFTAHYKYLGVLEENEKKFDVIQTYYEMSFTVDMKLLNNRDGEIPVTTTGFSSQLIFWDNEKGVIDHYSESFKIEIITNLMRVLTFTGTAHAEVNEFQRTATQETVDEVEKKINELGIENVNVKKTEKGLTLSIENIQFKPDSDILLFSEKEKLNKIAEIIAEYPDNDLLITGHTALRGTEESRQQLSEQRAQAVADFLIGLGVKDSYHIFTQGKGAKEPVATNSTEEGRSKNRRVEITLMDN